MEPGVDGVGDAGAGDELEGVLRRVSDVVVEGVPVGGQGIETVGLGELSHRLGPEFKLAAGGGEAMLQQLARHIAVSAGNLDGEVAALSLIHI